MPSEDATGETYPLPEPRPERVTSVPVRRGEGPERFVPLDPPGAPMSAAGVVAGVLAERGDHAERPAVYVNMIATVDGRATVGGSTAALGAGGDLELLVELRTAADAIMVGVGTVGVEGYGRFMTSKSRRERRLAAGQPTDPPAILVSRSFDVPWEAGLFAAPEQPVIVYTERDGAAPSVAAPVEVVRLPACSPAAVLADLKRRGVQTLLCEGGPTLLRALVGDRLVDELFLTVFPQATADPASLTILNGPPLVPPAALSLRSVLRYGDELFLRYRFD
jgi:riboflavin biosynthesis pyrimidine reductase